MGLSLYGLCWRHSLPQKYDCKPALSQEIQSRQHGSIAHLVNPSTRKCVFLTSIQAKGQIIHCCSKKKQGHPKLLQILADPNKHAVLGEPKTPASAGLFHRVEFFQNPCPGSVHRGNCSRLLSKLAEKPGV